MLTNHKIIIGDSRQMDCLEDSSVQLVITSPLYWQLKDYGITGGASNLFAYVYLKNKTFLNAHLIKKDWRLQIEECNIKTKLNS